MGSMVSDQRGVAQTCSWLRTQLERGGEVLALSPSNDARLFSFKWLHRLDKSVGWTCVYDGVEGA
jgi:hypothetical protein